MDAWTRQPPHFFLLFLDKSRLSKFVLVLLSASVERFNVSRMRDFYFIFIFETSSKWSPYMVMLSNVRQVCRYRNYNLHPQLLSPSSTGSFLLVVLGWITVPHRVGHEAFVFSVGSNSHMDAERQHHCPEKHSSGPQQEHFPRVESSPGRTLVSFFFVATLWTS